MATSKHRTEVEYVVNADQAFVVADRLEQRYSKIVSKADEAAARSVSDPTKLKAAVTESARIQETAEQQVTARYGIEAEKRKQIRLAKEREFAQEVRKFDPFQSPNNSQSFAQTRSLLARREQMAEQAKPVEPPIDYKAFNAGIDTARAKTQALRDTLRQTQMAARDSSSPIWSTYETGARRAADRARVLYGALQDIRNLASRTTDPKIFASLQSQARIAEAQIDRLQNKMQRVVAGRTGAASRVAAGNQAFQQGLGTAAAIGSGFLPPEAGMALGIGQEALAAGVVSGAGLAVIGSVAIAGAAIVKVTKDIRTEAERVLRVEEQIIAARNKQILAGKQILEDLKKQREEAQQSREFGRFLSDGSDSQIEARRSIAQKLLNLNPTGPNSEQNKQEILALDGVIDQRAQQKIAEADAAFNRRFELRKSAEADAARFAVEQAKKIAESVKEGTEKVKELGKTWRDAFVDLAGQSNTDNPFVRIFIDSQKAIDDLKEKLKGLPASLRSSALASQQAFNANQLFGEKATNALGALDLRDLAAKFRDDSDQRRALGQAGINLSINELNRTGGVRGRNAEAILQNLNARKRLNDSITGDTPQQKLDRQLATLSRLDPKNSSQRSIIDQQILRLAGSLDPNTLRNDQREAVAQSAERQAVREETRFQEALKVTAESRDFLEAINKRGEALAGVAKRDGIAGVTNALNVTVNNESDSSLDVRTTPTRASARSTDILYGEQFR